MASKTETIEAFKICMCPPESYNFFKCKTCPYSRYENCADKLRADVLRVLEEDTKPTTKPATYENMLEHALDEYRTMKQKSPERVIMNETCYKLFNDERAYYAIPEGYSTFQGIRVEVIHTPEKDPFFVFVDSWNKVMLTRM